MTDELNVQAHSLSIQVTRPDGAASHVAFDRSGDLFLAMKAVPATEGDDAPGGIVMVLLDVDGEDRVIVDAPPARTESGSRRADTAGARGDAVGPTAGSEALTGRCLASHN